MLVGSGSALDVHIARTSVEHVAVARWTNLFPSNGKSVR